MSRRRSSSSAGAFPIWWAVGGLAAALGAWYLFRPDDAPATADADPFAGILTGGSAGGIGTGALPDYAPPAPVATPDRWPDDRWTDDPLVPSDPPPATTNPVQPPTTTNPVQPPTTTEPAPTRSWRDMWAGVPYRDRWTTPGYADPTRVLS